MSEGAGERPNETNSEEDERDDAGGNEPLSERESKGKEAKGKGKGRTLVGKDHRKSVGNGTPKAAEGQNELVNEAEGPETTLVQEPAEGQKP